LYSVTVAIFYSVTVACLLLFADVMDTLIDTMAVFYSPFHEWLQWQVDASIKT
jgi:hypothetical protein